MGRWFASRWGLPAVQIIRLRLKCQSGEFGRIGASSYPLFEAKCGRLEWLVIRTVVITIHLPYCRITTLLPSSGGTSLQERNSRALIAFVALDEEILRQD